MRSRDDRSNLDTFRLATCWEHHAWRETVLEDLEESGVTLSPLDVHVIRIRNLRAVTDDVFGALGVTEIEDNDK